MSPRSRNKLGFVVALAAGCLVAVGLGAFAAIKPSTAGYTPRTSAHPGIAAAKAMHIFSGISNRPVPAAAPAALQDVSANRANVPDNLLPGAADVTRAQTLVADVGQGRWSLVAAPTTKGQVCDVIVAGDGTATSSGCVSRLSHQNPISYLIGSGGGRPTILAGLAFNSVTAVNVAFAGVDHAATIGNGGFLYELPAGVTSITSLAAVLKDGSTVSYPVGRFQLG